MSREIKHIKTSPQAWHIGGKFKFIYILVYSKVYVNRQLISIYGLSMYDRYSDPLHNITAVSIAHSQGLQCQVGVLVWGHCHMMKASDGILEQRNGFL